MVKYNLRAVVSESTIPGLETNLQGVTENWVFVEWVYIHRISIIFVPWLLQLIAMESGWGLQDYKASLCGKL